TGLVDGDHIVTTHYDIRLDDRGHFRSIYDRQAEREVLQSGGRGNVLQVFEDRPAEYEAWNIDRHFEEKMWEAGDLTDCRITQNDSLCLRLR
ncbi:glycoside hydrolase family 38 C-terminal domain-containing protein, partial [Mycobacterium tuberculosis]|uniref:glycoside hydrolase family 38 C-terminal domain-containing protein n=1 Tax=Mycobacterium tuberculosis TaxID=1773 RepID=UPI001266168D